MRLSMVGADLGVLTYAEAGRVLGVSRQRVQQLVEAGVLSVSRRYGRVYVSCGSVESEVRRRECERRERAVR
jgi:excisionase family DNA binding protein